MSQVQSDGRFFFSEEYIIIPHTRGHNLRATKRPKLSENKWKHVAIEAMAARMRTPKHR